MEYFTTDKQHIDLNNIEIPGRILDIGGGGEGVISRRYGDRVVAIDKRKDELEESPDIGLKIIMDACELKFLDGSFNNITCFYSLMYMGEGDIAKVLAEAYRVLALRGCLWIWDTNMPDQATADVFLVPLEVKLPGKTISSTYGISWRKGQSLDTVSQKCVAAGFEVIESHVAGQGFFLRLVKQIF